MLGTHEGKPNVSVLILSGLVPGAPDRRPQNPLLKSVASTAFV